MAAIHCIIKYPLTALKRPHKIFFSLQLNLLIIQNPEFVLFVYRQSTAYGEHVIALLVLTSYTKRLQ